MHALAQVGHTAAHLLLQLSHTDTSQLSQDQVNKIGAAIAGMMSILFMVGLAVMAFMVFLFWRIFTKAGLSGPFALLLFLGPLGMIIVACILAFSEWKVIPAPQQVYYPPQYPPQIPPAPPTQL